MQNQQYPFSLEILKEYAESWAERFPIIEQVTFCHCIGSEASYALVVNIEKDTYYAYSEWGKTKGPSSDLPEELIPIIAFFNWQAGGEDYPHIEEELASAYYTPKHELDGWIWFVQPAGDLPTDLVAPGGKILYSRKGIKSEDSPVKEVEVQNIFRKVGHKAWHIEHEGYGTTVHTYEGYAVIRIILKEPGIPRDDVKIWEDLNRPKIKEGILHQADPETLAKIKNDIRKATNKLEIAKDTGNEAEALKWKKELDELRRQRNREQQPPRGSSNSKVKRNIRNLFNRAMEDLEGKHPDLWRYLKIHIRPTPQGFVYLGEVKWTTD